MVISDSDSAMTVDYAPVINANIVLYQTKQ